jgi:hypothetical protein
MSLRRIFSASVLLAVLGLLVSLSGPAQAQKEKKKVELDKETVALLAQVEEALKAKDTRTDKTHGGGSKPWDDAPSKPGFLIGMTVWPMVHNKKDIVHGIQPIYQTADGKKIGGTYGWIGTGAIKVLAKPGYAVGGLKMRTSFGTIEGMAITFFKITEEGLDKSDSYDSQWLGSGDPTDATKVGLDGNPILGVHGMIHTDAKNSDFGIGLVIMGEKKKK